MRPGGLYGAVFALMLAVAVPALAADAVQAAVAGPRVTVGQVRTGELVERVVVTGTLVAREEVLVGPEIEGFRVVEILAEDGDRVQKGQVLARLNRDTLDAMMAQNDAALARGEAMIAQARSAIAQAEAALTQSRLALGRTSQLNRSGYAAQATLDAQTQDEKANRARLDAAGQGLASAEAELANARAQRRELQLRLQRTEVRAPAAGIVSRRAAKVGAVASMAAEPLFRLIADGDIELEAEAPDLRISEIKPGDPAEITAGDIRVPGKVRLVASEIDRASRLGKVRISVTGEHGLRIGGFARGSIETRRAKGVTAPLSAVLYDGREAFVQVVRNDRIVSTRVTIGIVAGDQVEVVGGLGEGETIVLKAGAFLRNGDAVTPVQAVPEKVR